MWEIHLRRQVKFIFLKCDRFCEIFGILRDSAKCVRNAESILNCHIERSEISQNIDSSLRTSCYAQNDKMDCHDSASNAESRNDEYYNNRSNCGVALHGVASVARK
ncbi:hypothetical protein ACWIUD_03970 [Helicobacter sp. 23-1044]